MTFPFRNEIILPKELVNSFAVEFTSKCEAEATVILAEAEKDSALINKEAGDILEGNVNSKTIRLLQSLETLGEQTARSGGKMNVNVILDSVGEGLLSSVLKVNKSLTG